MTQGANAENTRRILGRVTSEEFVGRTNELARLVAQPAQTKRGLLLLLAPAAGVSELLRQAYDTLFTRHENTIPIYFALPRTEATIVSVAIEFLNTFLVQYIAFRRNEPSLSHAPLLLSDVLKLSPAADYEWIENLLATYQEARFSDDDELVRLCLSAPARVPADKGSPFVLFDGVAPVAGCGLDNWSCHSEFLRMLERSGHPFAFAGLRRQVMNAAHAAGCSLEAFDVLRLEKLGEADARQLVQFAAARQGIALNDETRDLLVQQFDGSPFFMSLMLQSAREKNFPLTSFLAFEQLYVDELLGGHLHRHFSSLLEGVVPQSDVRRKLIRLLHESIVTESQKAPFESWRKLLAVETEDLEALLTHLHIEELLTIDGGLVEVGGGPECWKDFLKTRFRLDVQNESRALVVAETTADALKRAPYTMASHYRRKSRLKLRELLSQFNFQLVPRILFHFDQFRESYSGASPEEIVAGLDAETDLIRLPQIFHVASCTAYNRQMVQLADEQSCAVGHAFEGAIYTDANQLVWLAAQIDSKLEVQKDLTELWYERLQILGRSCDFGRLQILLVAAEGFSEEASAFLRQHHAFGVSRTQMELLWHRLSTETGKPPAEENEFVAVLPMGNDNELLAADMVEKIARRSNFQPEAINQIKTAIVEACINACEHSHSPDRKIYQRFRIESDKLVVTISSRGVIPGKRTIDQASEPPGEIESLGGRRGWGLKLIRSLMDEVEFERVDDGTSLRMTKYLRQNRS
jgi:serine/threonine-protein kinase RsbW